MTFLRNFLVGFFALITAPIWVPCFLAYMGVLGFADVGQVITKQVKKWILQLPFRSKTRENS